jgi:ribonucleoside-diphosphate reductase alpha chain
MSTLTVENNIENTMRPLQQVCLDTLNEKYAKGTEGGDDGFLVQSLIRKRVSVALASNEKMPDVWESRFLEAQQFHGVIMGGRINSAAGTDLLATLINCFVQPIADATTGYDGVVPGIYRALEQAAETMRRGGGVGYSFSSLRPKNAKVKGTRSKASGPISYMKVFGRSCTTVESAGARRGAQMGILRVDHPEILGFITSKREKSDLSQFNLSVAVTDYFMECLESDTDFELVHKAEPSDELIDAGAYLRDDGMWVYETIKPSVIWKEIMENTYRQADPGIIFIDRVNQENNLYYIEVIEACNPCGEQFLPAYGCCCLGSINISALLKTGGKSLLGFDFHWDNFKKAIHSAVRMLDNVLDVTEWPLQEQKDEAMAKRRIGLGFTGLGSLLALLGLRYDRKEGRAFAKKIAIMMRDEAYRASIELAKEKGAFPLFDAEKYLSSGFAKRLPSDIREAIAKHGIRNSHLLSIAPTGTISMAFGDNCSNGLEPPFSWVYTRNKRMDGGGLQSYEVMDSAYRQYVENGGDPENLPESFVNALEMSPEDHLAMVEVFAPYVDSAISKTINCPVDIPFGDFEDIYLKAYKAGLKGITTYRPNDITGAVLEVKSKDKAPNDLEFDADRKISIERVPTPALASLRWPSRPETPEGNPAMTYMVKSQSSAFSVFVGHFENGVNHPFEVWINGQEQPRGLGALAKITSMDMRSEDRGWLKAKLDALSKCGGNAPFELAVPGQGKTIVASHVAALAKLVDARCTQLGAFETEGETPLIDSMFTKKEPKSGPDGSMAWYVDLKNVSAGDDCCLFVKEVVMPDGSHRPFSVWLSGEYPEALDGLCKSLSLDMRVIDPAWISKKLRSLADFPEAQGDFLAKVPGSAEGKMASQPSTVAYIARLILHRYRMLGILDDNGMPVNEMGIFHRVTGESITVEGTGLKIMAGKACSSCGVSAVIKKDGCDFCTACGEIGQCG